MVDAVLIDKFKNLRNYLNDHSSHFSYKIDSVSHLIDFKNVQINAYPTHSLSTFRRNLNTINAFQRIMIGEVAYWLSLVNNDSNRILEVMDSFIHSSRVVFSEET